MSFNTNSFNNRTVGPNGIAASHVAVRTTVAAQAQAILTSTNVNGVQGLIPSAGAHPGPQTFPNPLSYEEILIFNPVIAEHLSRIFAFTSPECATLADYPIRTPGTSPYDSPRTPVVARRRHITAERLLSQRPSYIKSLLIHSRGLFNVNPCTECLNAYNRSGEFLHYAGCISLGSWFNGACSNCIHDDHGARCSHKNTDNRKLSYGDWKKEQDGSRSKSPRDDDDDKAGNVRDRRSGRSGRSSRLLTSA